MIAWRAARLAWLQVVFTVVAGLALAQAPVAPDYTPQVFQPGKDVVWVPTSHALVDKMLDMARVTPDDFVIDLGSGDGRTVIAAAKRGVRAQGIEYNPDLVALSRRNAAAAGVSDRAAFVQADIFQSDLSQATVITLYLLPELNLRLRPTLLSLRPGTRVVSNSFKMGDWEPDDAVDLGAYLWIVPARVDGSWKLQSGELVLKQEYQKVAGMLKTADGTFAIANGRLRGDEISFVAGESQYRGRVMDKAIDGLVTTRGVASRWKAVR